MVKMSQKTIKLQEMNGFTIRFVDGINVCVVRSDNETLFVKKEKKNDFLRKVDYIADGGSITVKVLNEDTFVVLPGVTTNYASFVKGESVWHRLLKEYAGYAESFAKEQFTFYKNKSLFRIRFADENKIFSGSVPEDVYLIGDSHYEDIMEALKSFEKMGKIGFYEHPISPMVKIIKNQKTAFGVVGKAPTLYEYFVYSLDTVEDIDSVMFQFSPQSMMKHMTYSYSRDFAIMQEELKEQKAMLKNSMMKTAVPKVVTFQTAAVGV